MRFTEFKKQLQEKTCPIYLLEGEDAFFRKRGITLLKSIISEPEINYAEYTKDEEDKIVSALNSMPFLSAKRLTVVYEYYPDEKHINKDILAYLENPSESSIFAIVNENESDFLKKQENVTVVSCGKETTDMLGLWIKHECKTAGVGIEESAVQRIIEYCLSDMSRIEQETQKLISYRLGETITETDVKEMVALSTDYKIYEMTDYLVKKRADKAIDIINDMMSRGETPQRIIVSVFNYFRKLLFIAISNQPLLETAKLLGMKEYPAKKAKEQASKFKIRSLKKAIDLLEDADYRLKNGEADADGRMWLTIFKIMIEN